MERRVAAAERAEAAQRAEAARAEARRQAEIERLERSANMLRDQMYECTTGEVRKLVRSSETAEVLATAAMTICRREVDATVNAHVDLIRVKVNSYTDSDAREARERLRTSIRDSVVTTAVRVRAETSAAAANASNAPPSARTVGRVPPESATPPHSSPTNVSPELSKCLAAVNTVQQEKLVERDKLIEAMLDLCRPEIETMARAAFLKDPSVPLQKARENALEAAAGAAEAIVDGV
jgi:hypothetical protein